MSEAPPSAIDAALARLAELELAWVEHVHAQGMATTDKDEINAIGRTIHRADRSLRQTLWMQARRERQRAEDQRRAAREVPRPPPDLGRLHHPDVGARAQDLFEAVGRIACAMYSDAPMGQDPERDAVLAEQERMVSREAERADFLDKSLDDHIRAHCEALDLPVELVACWLGLPPAPWGDPGDADYVPGPVSEPDVPAPPELTQEQLRDLLRRAKPRRHNTS